MNFSEALNLPGDEIERPPLLPVGAYVWMVEKIPALDETPKEWSFVDFPLKLVRPTDSVDADALQAYGNLTNVRQRHRFIFDKNDETAFKRTLYNLKRFLAETLKVEGVENVPLKQALSQSVNHQLIAEIVWKKDKNDDEIMHANIGKVAPVA